MKRSVATAVAVALSFALASCDDPGPTVGDAFYSAAVSGIVSASGGAPVAGAVVEGWTHQTSGWQHPNDSDTTDSSGRYSLILREFGPGGYACWQDSARLQVSRTVAGGPDTLRVEGIPLEMCSERIDEVVRNVSFPGE